jgi:hypothetical protein
MSKNVTVTGTDRVVVQFLEKGEFSLRPGEGTPVVSSGSKVNNNAQAHGTVPGTTVLVQNPA